MADPPQVVLYVRAGCHLCEQAREALRRLAREVAFELREEDVDADPSRAGRYGEHVPVVTLDGREIAEGRIEVAALRQALREGRRAGAVDRTGGRS